MESNGEMMSSGKLLILPSQLSLALLPAEPSSSKSGGTWRR
jgi:hypothetical protein